MCDKAALAGPSLARCRSDLFVESPRECDVLSHMRRHGQNDTHSSAGATHRLRAFQAILERNDLIGTWGVLSRLPLQLLPISTHAHPPLSARRPSLSCECRLDVSGKPRSASGQTSARPVRLHPATTLLTGRPSEATLPTGWCRT